jgi:type IV secretory pathway VirB2 component (pilin)
MTFFERLTARTVLAASTLVAGASTALAQIDPCPDVEGLPDCGTGGAEGIKAVIGQILAFVLDLLGIIAVIYIIIAGIRLIVSQGEDEQKDKAKKTILYVVVGLIVILVARVIVGFVTGTVPGILGA